jgi:hypothetical protein
LFRDGLLLGAAAALLLISLFVIESRRRRDVRSSKALPERLAVTATIGLGAIVVTGGAVSSAIVVVLGCAGAWWYRRTGAVLPVLRTIGFLTMVSLGVITLGWPQVYGFSAATTVAQYVSLLGLAALAIGIVAPDGTESRARGAGLATDGQTDDERPTAWPTGGDRVVHSDQVGPASREGVPIMGSSGLVN